MSDDQHNAAPLRLFNSLTRSTEPFTPIEQDHARVYSCGPTVYNYAHIGNLRAYVFTDTLRRTLLWKGLAVTHIINITDVGHLTSDADAGDDKMEAAARASAKSIWDIAAPLYSGVQAEYRRPQHFAAQRMDGRDRLCAADDRFCRKDRADALL